MSFTFVGDFIYCNLLNRQLFLTETEELLTVTFSLRSKIDVEEQMFSDNLETVLRERKLELLNIIPYSPATKAYFAAQLVAVVTVIMGGTALIIGNVWKEGWSTLFHSLLMGLLQVFDIYPVYCKSLYTTDVVISPMVAEPKPVGPKLCLCSRV